jgi:hypothetical protein
VLYLLSISCVLTLVSSTLLFSLGYLRLLLSTRQRGGLHQRTRRFLGVVSQPTSLWCPVLHVFILHFRIPWTDSWFSCNKDIIYNLYAFISRYVLWYLDDSVVYMHDLILAHIWLLGLCSYKSGVTELLLGLCSYKSGVTLPLPRGTFTAPPNVGSRWLQLFCRQRAVVTSL